MEPDRAVLPERLAHARRVLAFAEAAGDESAIRVAGMVVADLLAGTEEHGCEAGPGASDARSARGIVGIYEMVGAVLAERFDIGPACVYPDVRLADLGLDYLGAVELLTGLGERMGFAEFGPLVLPADATLAHVVDHLETHAQAQGE